ncbi:hypothetical protein Agub_g485 [Astrephomene gubernaculifera]|uniref:Uncharacterized protein n=1 Tax=Astrephomene gubernaculifera TaxID=47775 RepID=A0AAD3DH47_9CHLO|nr:hypothetical protein Agub_g485 [Astrephomene gubernaculifera]
MLQVHQYTGHQSRRTQLSSGVQSVTMAFRNCGAARYPVSRQLAPSRPTLTLTSAPQSITSAAATTATTAATAATVRKTGSRRTPKPLAATRGKTGSKSSGDSNPEAKKVGPKGGKAPKKGRKPAEVSEPAAASVTSEGTKDTKGTASSSSSTSNSSGTSSSSSSSSSSAGRRRVSRSDTQAVEARKVEVVRVIEDGLHLPPGSLKMCPSYLRALSGHRPETIAARIAVLQHGYPDPAHLELLVRAALARPDCILTSDVGAFVRRLAGIERLYKLGPKKGQEEKEGEGAAPSPTTRALQLAAREPRLLAFETGSLERNLGELGRLMDKGPEFALAMAEARPQLLVAYNCATLRHKYRVLGDAAESNNDWAYDIEVAHLVPDRIAALLCTGVPALARLTYLAEIGETNRPLMKVLRTSRELFTMQYPGFDAWLVRRGDVKVKGRGRGL